MPPKKQINLRVSPALLKKIEEKRIHLDGEDAADAVWTRNAYLERLLGDGLEARNRPLLTNDGLRRRLDQIEYEQRAVAATISMMLTALTGAINEQELLSNIQKSFEQSSQNANLAANNAAGLRRQIREESEAAYAHDEDA